MILKTSRREIQLNKAIVMGILNVTPDSFSDGGRFFSLDEAIKHAERMISEGATIIDVGGESTRPGSIRVEEEEELRRTVPVIEKICSKFDIIVSIDTTKSKVAEEALNAGAEIVNDISGLRFDKNIARVVAERRAGIVLMHSRGSFETMHKQEPVSDIFSEVVRGLKESLKNAFESGIEENQIILDIGLGFSKTPEQNLEILAKLEKFIQEFAKFPMLVGSSRKSFIGKILEGADVSERLYGTLATVAISVWKGAKIIRVHDVKAAVDTVRMIEAIKTYV